MKWIKVALLALPLIFYSCSNLFEPEEKIVTEYVYETVVDTVNNDYEPFMLSAGAVLEYNSASNEYRVVIWGSIILRDTLTSYTNVKFHGVVLKRAGKDSPWAVEDSNYFYEDWKYIDVESPIIVFNKKNQEGVSMTYFPFSLFPNESIDGAEWFCYTSWETIHGKFLGRRTSGTLE